MEIRQAKTKEDYIRCWDVVKELRPHLDLERYLVLMLYMQDEGYKMIYVEDEGRVTSICGYRYETMLHRGRSIYIDDLCTAGTARGKGHASTLLRHVIAEAKEQECQSVHLDSGFQRHDAHRLYLNEGFKVASLHFARVEENEK